MTVLYPHKFITSGVVSAVQQERSQEIVNGRELTIAA